MQDLNFPYDHQLIKDRITTSDWLIGAAVRFEYGDNGKSTLDLFKIKLKFFIVEKYKPISSNVINGQQKPNLSNQNGNPLETIDCKLIKYFDNLLYFRC